MPIATTITHGSTKDCFCRCAPLLAHVSNMRASREAVTPDLQARPSAAVSLARLSLPAHKSSSGVRSSATWTSTSGDLGGLSDTDEIGDRQELVEEYNRLSQKVCFLVLTCLFYTLTCDSMASVQSFPTIPRALRWVLRIQSVPGDESSSDSQSRPLEFFPSAVGGHGPFGGHQASRQRTVYVANAVPAMP